MPKDRDGNDVVVGTLVRVLRLSGQWLDDLPEDERTNVLSMVGQTFRVHEVDSYGSPWVMKEWPGEQPNTVRTHDVALDQDEMLVVTSDNE